jgi:hypothetical protein
MTPPATFQSQLSKTTSHVFLLCDLTEVIEFFRNTSKAERLLEMPEFVVPWTKPVLLGVTPAVDLDLGIGD